MQGTTTVLGVKLQFTIILKELYLTWLVKYIILKQEQETTKAEYAKKQHISYSFSETHLQSTASNNHVICHARNTERHETLIIKDKSEALKYTKLSFH